MSNKRRQKLPETSTFAFPGTPPSISRARSNSLLAVPNDGPTPDASPQPRKRGNVSNPPEPHSPVISPQRGMFKFFFSIPTSQTNNAPYQVALVYAGKV